MEYGILSLAIPLLTIILAIITKDVIISLLGGIFVGYLVLNGYEVSSAFFATFDGLISLFGEGWITKTVIFMLLVGSIIRIFEDSGAVDRFVNYLDSKAKSIDSPRGAMLLAYIIGVVIFIESSITSMVAGTVAKPLCDKNSVSREKLAYICDSTSAAIFTLLIVLAVIFFDLDIGLMKRSKPIPYVEEEHSHSGELSLWQMMIPLVVMIAMVPLMLYYTGKGEILKGSGSTSVYYSVIFTLISIYIYYIPTKIMHHKEYFKSLYKGMGEMIPVTIILVLALLIGSVIKDLGTAAYLAKNIGGNIPIELLPFLIFVISAVTAFSTGTSWGTFSIMMPIALALAGSMDLYIPLTIAAVISGGIFGDHSSPISDTTIISSMASGCDHIEHVRTQMPYALIGGVFAGVAFLISGYLTA